MEHKELTTEAVVAARKEMLILYLPSYWPTDEQLGSFTQEEFEEAIIHIEEKNKADSEDEKFAWREETLSDTPRRRLDHIRDIPTLIVVSGFNIQIDGRISTEGVSKIRSAIEKILSV